MHYRIIAISQDRETKVDPEDHAWLNKYSWYFHEGYARRAIKDCKIRTIIGMHQAILEHHGTDMSGLLTDHINQDKLDNQKTNLRTATRAENAWNAKKHSDNSSGYRGVSRHGKKWQVHIMAHGVHEYLGLFDDKVKGAKAYDRAALKLHGRFASLNFPEEGGINKQGAPASWSETGSTRDSLRQNLKMRKPNKNKRNWKKKSKT